MKLQTLRRLALWSFGVFIATPIVLWIAFVYWLSFVEWQGTRVVVEYDLGEGEILRLIEVPATSPADSTAIYKVLHRSSETEDFKLVDVFAQPRPPAAIEFSEDGDLLIVASQQGRGLKIRSQDGFWHAWDLEDVVLENTARLSSRVLVPGMGSFVQVETFHPERNEVAANLIAFAGAPPQSVAFEYDSSGQTLSVKMASVPAGPRPAYQPFLD